MLQQLGFMGFIAVFSVLAFVPPGEEQAMHVKEVGALLPRAISFHDVNSVIPLVTSHVHEQSIHQISSTALRSVQQEVTKIVMRSAPSNDIWRGIASASDDTTRHQFLTIEWAREERDRTECSVLSAVSSDYDAPSRGDWIAYCFARVTGNPDRCEQISSGTQPALKTLCEKEFLPSNTNSSFLATLLPW